MEYLTLVIVLAVVAALGWFAYGMDPHYASKDGTRFLSNTQEFMGGRSLARKRESRCSVLPDGSLHVVQKAGLRRRMQVWKLTGKQPHVTLSDSRANVAAIVALLESAKTGRPIKI